jgi:hypothetical protein
MSVPVAVVMSLFVSVSACAEARTKELAPADRRETEKTWNEANGKSTVDYRIHSNRIERAFYPHPI